MDGSDKPSTEPTTTAPRRRWRPEHPRAAITIAVLVLALVGAGLWSTLSGKGSDDGTPASLCALLRDGWTGDELAANDEWKTWPDRQSPTSRRTEIVVAASKGDCFQLI